MVGASRNAPVQRRALEQCLRDCLPTDRRTAVPVRMHTSPPEEQPPAAHELTFGWKKFFGRAKRLYPSPTQWDGELVHQLRETKQWMLAHRDTRRIRLSGERRLSASLAFGFVFSAVGGFTVEMESGTSLPWVTDQYAGAATPPHVLRVSEMPAGQAGPDLMVELSFVRDISAQVADALLK